MSSFVYVYYLAPVAAQVEHEHHGIHAADVRAVLHWSA